MELLIWELAALIPKALQALLNTIDRVVRGFRVVPCPAGIIRADGRIAPA
jgi:hypothetical protein